MGIKKVSALPSDGEVEMNSLIICSFSKHFMSDSYVPDSGLDTEDTAENRSDRGPSGSSCQWGRQTITIAYGCGNW